jgi:hypothetical protein
MSTSPKRSAVLAGAAAAIPALLFVGTGPAQAETHVNTTSDALGVTVHIQSYSRYLGLSTASRGWCTYTAVPVKVPVGVLPPLPVYNVPFFLQERGTHDLWFPGIQTGTTWDVTVRCPEGIDSDIQKVVY